MCVTAVFVKEGMSVPTAISTEHEEMIVCPNAHTHTEHPADQPPFLLEGLWWFCGFSLYLLLF